MDGRAIRAGLDGDPGRRDGRARRARRAAARLAVALVLAGAAPLAAEAAAPPGGADAAGALPTGDAVLTYQLRALRSDDPAFPDVTDQDLGLHVSQEIPNRGILRLEGHLFDAAGDGLDRGWTYASLQDLELNGIRLEATLGDTEVSAGLLPTRVLVTVDPFFEVEGATLEMRHAGGTLTVFGGRAVDRAGSFATAVVPLDQDVVGFRLAQGLAPRVGVSALYVHTEGAGADPVTDQARSGDTFGLGAHVGLVGPLALVGEVRYATDAGLASRGEDEAEVSYLVGPVLERPGLRLEASAFALGRAYVPVAGATQSGDRRGLFAAGSWEAIGTLGLFGSVQRVRNNLAGDPALTTTERTQLLGGGRITLPTGWPLTVVSRVELTTLESLPGAPAPVDSTTTALALDLSQVIGAFRPILRSRWARLADDAIGERATVIDLSAELWWQVTRRSRAWLVAQWWDQSATPGLADARRHLGRAGGEQRVTANLFLRGEAEVSRSEELGVATTRTALSGSLSYRHHWFDVYLDFRRDWADSSAGSFPTRADDALYVRVAAPLRWGRPTPPPVGRAAGAGAGGWGRIAGQVFADLDGDGRRGPGEPGLEGLRVVLDGLVGEAVTTDAEGRFRIERVATGPHSVRLEVRRLPADYDLVSPQLRDVVVRLRDTAAVDFVVQPLGRIEGRVVRRVVGPDGSPRSTLPASGISLLLRRGDEVWQTFTDDDGVYRFDNVRAGSYDVAIDPSTLPETARVDPEARRVTVGVGETVAGRDFAIAQPGRREIRNGAATLPAEAPPAAPPPAEVPTPPPRSPPRDAGTPGDALRLDARSPAERSRDCFGDSPEPGMVGFFRFATDSAEITGLDLLRPDLARWSRWLRDDPGRRILIEGHTDRRADDPYNFGLGARRAYAVHRALAEAGAPERQMQIVSEGPDLPCDPANHDEAYTVNRRALIIVGEVEPGAAPRSRP